MVDPALVYIVVACVFVAGFVWWFSTMIAATRHSKDNQLQELQSQIDVLQIQVRELQIACKGMGGNGFTRTLN